MSEKVLFIEWCADDALGGTANMEPMTELVYRRLIDLIYSTNDKLLDNDSLQYGTKAGAKWKKIRAELIEVHKKIYIENGYIRNRKCTEKIEKSRANIEQKRLAGIASAEKRKSLENNETGPTAVGTAVTTGVPTNQEPNNQGSKTPDDIGAREKSPHRIVGEEISKITGWDQDPNWLGNYSRIEQWLANGWDAEMDIYPTVKAVMAKKRDGPPRCPKYFEKAIADAHATRTAPIPKGKTNGNTKRNNQPDIAEQSRALLEQLGES